VRDREAVTDLVGHDPEAALGCGWAVSKDLIDEAKQLLHDCILAQVIITRLHQLPMAHASTAHAPNTYRKTI